MKDLIEEFEKTGYIAWINADIYPDGRIYTQEFTEWLAKKVKALQPTNSTECIKSDVGQSLATGAEIETASFNYATKMSNAPDKETPDWIQADFKAGAKWAIEQLTK